MPTKFRYKVHKKACYVRASAMGVVLATLPLDTWFVVLHQSWSAKRGGVGPWAWGYATTGPFRKNGWVFTGHLDLDHGHPVAKINPNRKKGPRTVDPKTFAWRRSDGTWFRTQSPEAGHSEPAVLIIAPGVTHVPMYLNRDHPEKIDQPPNSLVGWRYITTDQHWVMVNFRDAQGQRWGFVPSRFVECHYTSEGRSWVNTPLPKGLRQDVEVTPATPVPP